MIDQASPVSHWGNTSGNDIIRDFIKKSHLNAKREIESLLTDNAIEKPLIEDMTYTDIYKNKDHIWSFLFYTGYLTAERIETRNGVRYAGFRIPNQEVEYIYVNKINDWFDEVISEDYPIVNFLLNKDADSLRTLLNKLLFHMISYMDYSENYYHGILADLLAREPNYVVKSNRETGLGRADITLLDEQTAIIIEIKVAKKMEQLEAACEAALEQIERKEYAKEFCYHECIKVGLAFCMKSCFVKIV